jgi:hypothetical protein
VIPPGLVLAPGLLGAAGFSPLDGLEALGRTAIGFCVASGICLALLWQIDLSAGYRWVLSSAAVTVTLGIGLQRHR